MKCCHMVEQLNYELYLGVSGISHAQQRPDVRKNVICERFQPLILQEFFKVTFRRELYHFLQELQVTPGAWIDSYN